MTPRTVAMPRLRAGLVLAAALLAAVLCPAPSLSQVVAPPGGLPSGPRPSGAAPTQVGSSLGRAKPVKPDICAAKDAEVAALTEQVSALNADIDKAKEIVKLYDQLIGFNNRKCKRPEQAAGNGGGPVIITDVTDEVNAAAAAAAAATAAAFAGLSTTRPDYSAAREATRPLATAFPMSSPGRAKPVKPSACPEQDAAIATLEEEVATLTESLAKQNVIVELTEKLLALSKCD